MTDRGAVALTLPTKEQVRVSFYSIPSFYIRKQQILQATGIDYYNLVVKAIEEVLNITEKRLKSACSKQDVVRARAYLYLIVRRHTNLSLMEIAKMSGKKDHTTVMYNLKVIRDRIRLEEPVAKEFSAICNYLDIPA